VTIRVLVVDDSAEVRRLLIAIFECSGEDWDVVGEAENGREAIEMAATTEPDLVLLDLCMPDLDGLDALPQILAAAPGTTVVVLSGFPQVSAGTAAVGAGASLYLEKDALVATLIPKLRGVFPVFAASATPGDKSARQVSMLGVVGVTCTHPVGRR